MKLTSLIKRTAKRLWREADKPVPALPLDLFRVGVGLLSAAYFWRTYREVGTISSKEGFIDHKLVERMFPYTRLGLFSPETSDGVLRVVNTAAIGASLSMAAGIGIRPNALFLYLIAVSTYRRNFIAMYVDDALMHLVLFWSLFLPAGNTLTLNRKANQPWQTAQAPGFIPRAFLINLSLIYFVAGAWKWNSKLWREGLALYASLRMPIAHHPNFWSHRLQPLLKPFSITALAIEPLFAALPFLPDKSYAKSSLAISMVGFHAGIIGGLRLPFANIACLAALPLLFSEELMHFLAPGMSRDQESALQTPVSHKAITSAFLALLTLANIWRIPERHPVSLDGNPRRARMRHHSNPWHAPLWLIGIAQSYRLVDWIDELNWHTYYDGVEEISAEIHPFNLDTLFPNTTRNIFLQSYVQDRSWMIPPIEYLEELQASLLTRYVAHFSRTYHNTGKITIHVNTARITHENIDLKNIKRYKLLQFSVQDGIPTINFMHLSARE